MDKLDSYKETKLKINHKKLTRLLQKAYSAEKAAAFAYQGHAASVKNTDDKKSIHQIEIDEWEHRSEVLKIMKEYDIPISKFFEIKFHLIGKVISLSCFFIGRFMPNYFAGRLESGNVCEYFKMKNYFNSINISIHDNILIEMGIKEKEHEIYFLDKVKEDKWLPFFEKIFSWGKGRSFNDIEL